MMKERLLMVVPQEILQFQTLWGRCLGSIPSHSSMQNPRYCLLLFRLQKKMFWNLTERRSVHSCSSQWSSITLRVQRERVAPEAKDLFHNLTAWLDAPAGLSAAGDGWVYSISRTSTASIEIWALFGDQTRKCVYLKVHEVHFHPIWHLKCWWLNDTE